MPDKEIESLSVDGVGAADDGHSCARAALRSEAEQRTSLDYSKNNRYSTVLAELRARGRRRYCGTRTIRGEIEGRTHYFRLDCKTWGCGYCGPRKARRFKHALIQTATRERLNRFLTLTLDPRKLAGDSVAYLREVFNKFRVYLHREFKTAIKYIAVLEFHKNGRAHLHVLIDRYIKQRWISKTWRAVGGGSIVDIRFVDVHRISHYLAKYLTKELLLSAPTRARRVTTSRSIKLFEKPKTIETQWAVLALSVFHYYSIYSDACCAVRVDDEGFLFSFAIQLSVGDPHSTTTTLTLEVHVHVSLAVLFVS